MRGGNPLTSMEDKDERDKGNERRDFDKDAQRYLARNRQAESRSLGEIYRCQVPFEESFERGGAR